jgi:hypothetical protein
MIARAWRWLLRLDRPAEHLTAFQYMFAVVVAFSSAALWGTISGVTGLWLPIFIIQLYPAWVTPRADERVLTRMLWSHMIGAAFAGSTAVGRLMMRHV